MRFALCVMLIFCKTLFSQEIPGDDWMNRFSTCLQHVYCLDPEVISTIQKRIENEIGAFEFEKIESDFTRDSKTLLSELRPKEIDLLANDAVKAAPKSHEILYEDKRYRILFASIPSGDTVALHHHQYDGVFLTIKGSTFQTFDASSIIDEEFWGMSSEIIRGSLDLLGFKNIGPNRFLGILFEIK